MPIAPYRIHDMVKTITRYEGNLRCSAVHEPSGAQVYTDSPLDNHGKGESFSPTDLVGAALAGCMMTIMGIFAERKGLDLKGLTIEVGKSMNADPRRIGQLEVTINVPLPADHPDKDAIINAALTCPVKRSLNPEIQIPITWNWIG